MKRFVITIIVVLAVSATWTAGWFYIAGQIRAEIDHLAQADGYTQPRLTCETLSVGGLPFSFSPYCENAELVVADTSITLPDIRGTALFYRPFHIQVLASGPARITDAFTGAAQQVDWSNLHASLRLENGAIGRFSAIADDIAYADILLAETEIATAARAEIHLIDATPPDSSPGTGQVLDVFARLNGLDSQPFAIADGQLTIDGQLTGLPDPGLWGHPQALAYWQALNGALILRELQAEADGLMISAAGEARLTDRGLVDGNLDIASQGVVARLGQMGDDSVARIFLGNPDQSGVSRQRLTVTDGTAVVGILPIATLPPLF